MAVGENGKFKAMVWKALGSLVGVAIIALSTFTYNVTTTLATMQAKDVAEAAVTITYRADTKEAFKALNTKLDDIDRALGGSNVSEALLEEKVGVNKDNIKTNKDNLSQHERSKVKDVH